MHRALCVCRAWACISVCVLLRGPVWQDLLACAPTCSDPAWEPPLTHTRGPSLAALCCAVPVRPQLEPKDLSEQLKRTGAAIPGIRPGKQTAEYVASTLTRMSLLGSIFLGALSLAPAAVEGLTHLSAFRGFAGTSVLIMVGVATDTARRLRAEQAMAKYQDVDKLYDDLKN